ncbi:MAG: hypothetical protein AB7R69_05185 [Candidatus Babeliales bacterium]
MNKKFSALLLFAALSISQTNYSRTVNLAISLDDNISNWPISGLTFYSERPVFRSASPEKTVLFRDRALARECGLSGAFQVVPLGGRSGKRGRLNEWFTFNNLETVIVAEDAAPGFLVNGVLDPNFRNVNALHFNIQTVGRDFKSAFIFQPRHSFAGVGIDHKQYLHSRDACEKKWWFEWSTPIIWVQHDMNITESILNQGTPLNDNVNTSIKEAFKGQKGYYNANTGLVTGEKWHYGKINGTRERVFFGDFEVKLGYDFVCEEDCHADGYIGGIIPASTKPDSEYVFEPLTGNGNHAGVMFGGSAGWEYWSRCEHHLAIEAEFNWRYLFKNTQRRTIEFQKKPWSRYMLIFKNFEDTQNNIATNAINEFSPKVEVRPRFNADVNLGFLYTRCNLELEAGYNVWFRQSEKVSAKEFNTEAAFAAVPAGITIANRINRAITIGENFDSAFINVINQATYEANRIYNSNMNFGIASHPTTIAHTIYSSIGGRWDHLCFPVASGIGASYSFSSNGSTLNKWMLWGKLAVSV